MLCCVVDAVKGVASSLPSCPTQPISANPLKKSMSSKTYLVAGFNPSEKYARQNGNLPQIGMKINNI